MSFSSEIAAWAQETKQDLDLLVRRISLEILSRVIDRSPVGNPTLWKANADVIRRRERYNADVDAVNNFIRTSMATAKYSNVKLRIQRHASPKTIAKKIPLVAGRRYTGGRFKANWIVTVGSPSTSPIDRVDPSGGEALAAGAAVIESAVAGQSIFIMNNLPYAQRIEYGWSKQQPAGCVRVTIAELNEILLTEIRKISPRA